MKPVINWTEGRIEELGKELADLRARMEIIEETRRSFQVVLHDAKRAAAEQEAATQDMAARYFDMTLGKVGYERGILNVPSASNPYVTQEGTITLLCPDGGPIFANVVNNQNGNGTARIHGGAALRDWFGRYSIGDGFRVSIASPSQLELLPLYLQGVDGEVAASYEENDGVNADDLPL